MASVDVTVCGAGIFGLSTAWALAKRGARVRVIETRAIGAGASGGLVGALAPHAPEVWNEMKALQFRSLIMAAAWWDEVHHAGGADPLYLRAGRLQPVTDRAALELARARETAARDLWQGAAEWRVIPATGAPWEPASPSGWLISDTLTARISPRQALASLAQALRARGGTIGQEGTVGPGLVVHATGYEGLAELSAHFGRKLGAGVKGQAVLLRHDAQEAPQIYAPGLHIVAHGDGTVAVGSTSESTWETPGPDGQAETLITRAREVLPVLHGAEVLERWAGIRPRAKSRSPVIGAWPGRPGHFIANGGFKTGFGMAPVCAELLADLIAEGRDMIPAAFLPATLLQGALPPRRFAAHPRDI
ncbi:FAD-binding oxidoreductase [Pseudomonas sp. GX19020]|uniref:NAD(P)/FAD-dependent oxidoreductase n=1 Tax=Pseudomonas sp. GX19020 TaxID=2942277 RepID=UPI002018E285|nr:FAD-binding oxidoreductase [Pseudomonas sp. GX19020]MCL4069056.1 FAD-binding oxidoreductase [Pseudomonas sp. GX19020]